MDCVDHNQKRCHYQARNNCHDGECCLCLYHCWDRPLSQDRNCCQDRDLCQDGDESIFLTIICSNMSLSESAVALSMLGWHTHDFWRLSMKTYLYRGSNLKSIPSLFWPQFRGRSQFLATTKNRHFLTLYVGLAHAVPPTNTKFKPLLFPTQAGMPYATLTSTEHHISSLHSRFWGQLSAASPLLQPDKNRIFLRFFIIIILNFKMFSNISSDEIHLRSACKCLQNLYQSVAILLKYVLFILLLRLLKYLGL